MTTDNVTKRYHVVNDTTIKVVYTDGVERIVEDQITDPMMAVGVCNILNVFVSHNFQKTWFSSSLIDYLAGDEIKNAIDLLDPEDRPKLSDLVRPCPVHSDGNVHVIDPQTTEHMSVIYSDDTKALAKEMCRLLLDNVLDHAAYMDSSSTPDEFVIDGNINLEVLAHGVLEYLKKSLVALHLEVGKTYLDNRGDHREIREALDPSHELYDQGYRFKDKLGFAYTADGKFLVGNHDNTYDLVEEVD